MKRIVMSLCTVIMLVSVMLCVGVCASDEISVILDGQKMEFEVEPIIINGRTMVPMRAIFSALGAKVDWDDTTRTAFAVDGNGTTVSFAIGSDVMYVGEREVTLDSPSVIRNNRTLVPIRAVSEAMNCFVGWDYADNTVSIVKDTQNYKLLYTFGQRSRIFEASKAQDMRQYGWFETDLNQNNESTVMTIAGRNIGFDEFKYYYNNMLSYYDGDKEKLKEKAEHDKFVGSIEYELKRNIALELLSSSLDVYITDTDYKTLITDYVDAVKYNLGNGYEQQLKNAMMTQEVFENQLRLNALYEKFYSLTTSGGGIFDFNDVETVKNFAVAKNAIRAKHILIQFGQDNSKENKKEKLALAKEVLERAKAGEDFDLLVDKYNTDPGMQAYPDGYYFVEGEMVDEFYKASAGLDMGEISDIVETAYGYHIIQRLPIEDKSLMASGFAQNLIPQIEQEIVLGQIANVASQLSAEYIGDFDTKYNYEAMIKLIQNKE